MKDTCMAFFASWHGRLEHQRCLTVVACVVPVNLKISMKSIASGYWAMKSGSYASWMIVSLYGKSEGSSTYKNQKKVDIMH